MDEHPDEHLEERPGFFVRWVMPVLFVIVVVSAFWFLGRMSVPLLEADADTPEDHFTAACWVCHRSE